MTCKAPGKSHRKGITLVELTRLFPDDEAAEEWFASRIWPDGPVCPYCGSSNVQSNIKHRSMTHRCRDCRDKTRFFSLKTGTVMQSSKLGYQVWAIAIYLLATNLKGVSSMKLHRDFGITQKSAWHLAHRLRESFASGETRFAGPVEVDETFVGGKARNMHAHKREQAIKGRGTVGKTAVIGAKDRKTNRVSAAVIDNTDQLTLHGFVAEHAERGAKVYTDDHGGYDGLPNHETVRHSVKEYVNGQAHTNGIESFWSMPQTWIPRYLPQDEPEAPPPLRGRIRRAPQHPHVGHHRPNGRNGAGYGRQEVALQGFNSVKERVMSPQDSDFDWVKAMGRMLSFL